MASSHDDLPVWDTFVRRAGDLVLGRETPLVLRDLRAGRTKYRVRHVIGVIREGGEPGDKLIVRTVVGVALPREYAVEIKQELPQEIPGIPYRDFFQALARAAE